MLLERVMTTFKASVQYGDWKGTAAADNADQGPLTEILRARGRIQPDEVLIAADLWVGENHGGKLGTVFCRAYLYVGGGDFDTVQAALGSQPDPIPVKPVNLELTIEDFVLLFKRFNVVLTRNGLNLEGRQYTKLEA